MCLSSLKKSTGVSVAGNVPPLSLFSNKSPASRRSAALEPETVEREFGDDLKSALRQQWQVEEGHGVLSSTSQLAEGAARADLDEVRRQLGKSTRNLARTLRKHEQAVAFFKRRPTKSRSNEFVSCQQFLSDLTAVMFRKLSTTVEEETTNNSTLHDLTERERFAAEEATALQKTLEAQRAERDRSSARRTTETLAGLIPFATF